MAKKTSGLFAKALLALTMVSVVPVLLIGWHMLRADSRILQNEILDKQHTIAHRMAVALAEGVSREVRFFSIFTGLHSKFKEHPILDQADLEYFRRTNPHIIYLAVLNTQKKLLFSAGESGLDTTKITDWKNILHACIEQGKEYIGPEYTADQGLVLRMGFPVAGPDTAQPRILLAKVNLTGFNQIVSQNDMPDMQAFVLTDDGHVLSYADHTDSKLFQVTTQTASQIKEKIRKLQNKNSGQITLADGTQILVSKAQVPLLNWEILVEQPADILYTLLRESTFHSLRDVVFILLVLAAFIVAVAYWVLIPIVRPLERLQRAAVRLEQDDHYMPSESDLIIPNNEIGELCHVFLHMAETLKERKNALLTAQQKLLVSNEELEMRVRLRSEELENATNELVRAERLAAIGQMASIISHEIRNPLAVISNAAKLIKIMQPPTEPKLIKQFAIIDEEIRQANGIIGEVLGFARSRDMILSVIDLNSYVHEIVTSFPVETNIRLAEELDSESARLKIDAEEIKQALRNLISNACEAMPQGGTVTIGTRVGRKVVCLFVGDEGPGISAELKEKMFSPFFTTKARGTGLGLAVVHKAVMRHKGKLFVHNRPEKGAIFEIYLKLYSKAGDTRYG